MPYFALFLAYFLLIFVLFVHLWYITAAIRKEFVTENLKSQKDTPHVLKARQHLFPIEYDYIMDNVENYTRLFHVRSSVAC